MSGRCGEHDTALVYDDYHGVMPAPSWYCPCDPGHTVTERREAQTRREQ